MKDEELIDLLEGTDETIRLEMHLQKLLRDGFVNLSSAKFSKGFASTNITPLSFPDESFADKKVIVRKCDDENDESAKFIITTGNGKEEKDAQQQEQEQEQQEQQQDKEGKPTNVLRQRRKGKATEAVDSGVVTASSSSFDVDARQEEKKQQQGGRRTTPGSNNNAPRLPTVRKWLKIQPRGQLEKSQKAFEESLEVIIQLAEHNMKLKQKVAKFEREE